MITHEPISYELTPAARGARTRRTSTRRRRLSQRVHIVAPFSFGMIAGSLLIALASMVGA